MGGGDGALKGGEGPADLQATESAELAAKVAVAAAMSSLTPGAQARSRPPPSGPLSSTTPKATTL